MKDERQDIELEVCATLVMADWVWARAWAGAGWRAGVNSGAGFSKVVPVDRLRDEASADTLFT